MKKIVLLWMMSAVLFTSCGEYNKILKSTDYELKYSYAKKYFNAKQYSKSATLLDELVTIFKGTAYAEESLYLLAQSYYGQKITRQLRNISRLITRLTRKVSLLNWPVTTQAMVCT